MKKLIFIQLLQVVLILCCFHSVTAQSTGLIMDDSTYEQLPSGNLEKVKDHFIPDHYSLKAHTPFPASQGKIAACVGWATGYGALTIERAIKAGISDRVYITNELAHSAIYLYQHIKRGSGCQALASIDDALAFLQNSGDCLETTFPTPTIDCTIQPSDDAHDEALRYRIESPGYKVFSNQEDPLARIKAVKAHIAAGHPVIVGFSQSPPYRSLVGRDIWQVETRNAGGHAMVLVGYSDKTKRFELMNSYGTSWGKQGFIDISYEDFAAFCRQAFVINNDLGAKGLDIRQTEYSVPVSLRIEADILQSQNPLFQPFTFDLKEHVYRSKQSLKAYQPIRFSISIEKGRCAYLINMDSDGIARTLWSIDYAPSDTIVKIPEVGWWEFPKQGEEIFCLLYGYEYLPNLEEMIQSINSNISVDFRTRILQQTGIESCSTDKIKYEADRILAKANLDGKFEKLIPVFFTINITP